MIQIYALSDPRDGRIRYIGKTVQTLAGRLRTHRHAAKRFRDSSPKGAWIRELQSHGLKPDIDSLCRVDDGADWKAEECRLISLHREMGCDLLNVFRGGNGSHYIRRRVNLTRDIKARLGVEADAVIAEELGVTRKAITYHRNVRRIPASFDRTRNTPPPPMGGHNRIELPDEIIEQLGAVSDSELAKRAGVSKKRILRERRNRGVTSYAERTGDTGRFKPGNYPGRWKKTL